jgi:hypothetical protein
MFIPILRISITLLKITIINQKHNRCIALSYKINFLQLILNTENPRK